MILHSAHSATPVRGPVHLAEILLRTPDPGNLTRAGVDSGATLIPVDGGWSVTFTDSHGLRIVTRRLGDAAGRSLTVAAAARVAWGIVAEVRLPAGFMHESAQ